MSEPPETAPPSPASPGAAQASDALVETDRTRVRRLAERGRFDRATVNAILDEAYVAHVGFVVEGGPRVLPMAFGRDGRWLYLHGAVGNAMLRQSISAPVCVTITLLDGLVLARSTFHHSMNYRSVVLLGTAEKVDDSDEKRRALDVITDHVVPGRSAVVRPMTPAEVRATLVLRLPIEEGSAKIRTGPPVDEPEDLDEPVWAGVVPLTLTPGEPIQDELQVAEGDDLAALRSPVIARPGDPLS